VNFLSKVMLNASVQNMLCIKTSFLNKSPQKVLNEVSNVLYLTQASLLLQVYVITLSLQNNLKFPSSAPRHNLSILRCVNAEDLFHIHDAILHQSIKFSWAKYYRAFL